MNAPDHFPGKNVDTERMPGHWLLSRIGKRVLRPGGSQMTQRMLEALNIQGDDDVIEFAPGLGITAKAVLARKPRSYTGVERDEKAAHIVRNYLFGSQQLCLVGSAEQTGLPTGQASVVYGEAMLTMQGPRQKAAIIQEAARLLRTSGRYGIHELCLVPETLPPDARDKIERDLSATIHIGARPLTIPEWRQLLKDHGFEIALSTVAPMRLLEVNQLITDEGLGRALLIAKRLLSGGRARARVLAMRAVFRKHRDNLRAVAIVGVKKRFQ